MPEDRSKEVKVATEIKKSNTKLQKRQLVQEVAAKLRDIILDREPGAQIGSLTDVAKLLGVGIVTIQQAARILEHEGLLAVRRGPGGGYYGTRPDEAALERSMAAYMRVHGFGYREALEMTTLLDCDIVPAAALCNDRHFREAIQTLLSRIDICETRETRALIELELRDLLFTAVSRPLMELMIRVTTQFYKAQSHPPIFSGDEAIALWRSGRRRVLEAILAQDEELARFETERYRRIVISQLR